MAEQECLCLRDRGGARRHTPVRAGETQRCPERRLPLRSCSLGLGWAERQVLVSELSWRGPTLKAGTGSVRVRVLCKEVA